MAFTTIKDKDGVTLGSLQTDANDRLGVHNLLHVQDQKPVGTDGGTFTSGAWRTRDLNTVLINNIVGASLATNQVTLPAGTYWAESYAIVMGANLCTGRLYSVTNSDVLLTSSVQYCGSVALGMAYSIITGRMILTNSTVLEVQNKGESTYACGFGHGNDYGQAYNIFADLKIWKIA